MFLSQPPIATTPSRLSPPTTVSIESAITSRDTSEYFMPSVPIEIAVGHRDGVEDDALAAGRVHAIGGVARQLVDVHVARGDLRPGGTHADLRLLEIVAGESDRVQHGAAGRPFGTVDNQM